MRKSYQWYFIWILCRSAFYFYSFIEKFNAANYGKVGLFIATASVLGSMMTKLLLNHRWSVRKVMMLGFLIAFISSVVLLIVAYFALPYHHPVSAVFAIMLPYAGIIFGLIGLVLPGILTMALNKYQDCLGTAGAIFGLSYYVLIALLVSIMGFIHNGTIYPMPIYFLALTVTIGLALARIPFTNAKGRSNNSTERTSMNTKNKMQSTVIPAGR